MIWCDALSAVSVFVVLLTLVFGSWKVIFFATLVSSILSQFSQPAGMKLFKLHVPIELVQMGMSLYQTVFALFMILGPVLGTFVFQRFDQSRQCRLTQLDQRVDPALPPASPAGLTHRSANNP